MHFYGLFYNIFKYQNPIISNNVNNYVVVDNTNAKN